MKSLNELLIQTPVYLHNWSDKIELVADFEDIYIDSKVYYSEQCPWRNEDGWNKAKMQMSQALLKYEGINILFASYGTDNYSGDAFVLYEKEGKLFEVNGSHCSCYGLEGQFELEETDLESIKFRLVNGKIGLDDYSGNEYASELKLFLGIEDHEIEVKNDAQ